LYEAGAKQYELSAQFKVSFSMIGMIVNGRRWQHLTGGIRRGHRVAGSAHALSKLTEKDIPEIRRLQAEGVSMREIGRRYGVSSQTIRQIFTGKSWKQVPLAD
jgi:DNA-binding NarL/FixJ family response regulator